MVQADDHRAPGCAQPRHRFIECVGETEPRGGHHERQSTEQGQDDPGERGQQKGLFDAEALDRSAGRQEQRAGSTYGDGAGGDKDYPVGMTDRRIRQRGHEHANSEHSQEYADYVENRPNHFRRSHFVLVIERMTSRHAAKRECPGETMSELDGVSLQDEVRHLSNGSGSQGSQAAAAMAAASLFRLPGGTNSDT